MWDKTIKLPAYPCVGFTRLNNMGLGEICESDLRSALAHILIQGLSGKPGFISDPTVNESNNSIMEKLAIRTPQADMLWRYHERTCSFLSIQRHQDGR